MPHKDPRTGVTVMTTHEFFQAEAKREGKGRTGLDLMSDFADQFERDRLERENELRATAYQTLLENVREWNAFDPEIQSPEPEELIEVLAVECRDTIRQNSHMIKARCKRSGGVVDVITAVASQACGNMEEPPDYELNVTWDLLDGGAKP